MTRSPKKSFGEYTKILALNKKMNEKLQRMENMMTVLLERSNVPDGETTPPCSRTPTSCPATVDAGYESERSYGLKWEPKYSHAMS